MKDDKQLWNICETIYREMYKKSEPTDDWDDMVERGVTKNDSFFKDYYLPDEEHVEILDRHCKINKLTKRETDKVKFTVNLGSGPSSVSKDWDKSENISTS